MKSLKQRCCKSSCLQNESADGRWNAWWWLIRSRALPARKLRFHRPTTGRPFVRFEAAVRLHIDALDIRRTDCLLAHHRPMTRILVNLFPGKRFQSRHRRTNAREAFLQKTGIDAGLPTQI